MLGLAPESPCGRQFQRRNPVLRLVTIERQYLTDGFCYMLSVAGYYCWTAQTETVCQVLPLDLARQIRGLEWWESGSLLLYL
jgi:hypothetical protein